MSDDETPSAPPASASMAAARAAAQELLALFETHGQEAAAEGHQPFFISGQHRIWLVTKGPVHLFAVQIDGDRPVGAREHFVSVETGDVILGMDFAGSVADHGFLAVGTTGARVIEVPLGSIMADVRQGISPMEFAEAIDRWILAISAGVTRDIQNRPTATAVAVAGEALGLPKNGIASTRKDVVWVKAESSELRFLGTEELYFPASVSVFPLSPSTWVECEDRRSLDTFPTASLLGSGWFEEGLGNFHVAVCNTEFINKRLAQVDEFNRLKSKAEYQQIARESALAEIGAVLNPEFQVLTDARGDGDPDPLLAAVRLIGKAIGAEIKPHPNPRKTDTQSTRLQAICKASRVRFRDIALRDEWWRLDNGAMLAFTEKDHEPCALLPINSSSYMLVNGRTGLGTRVTAAVANSLHPIAKAIYRPFPDGPLTAWQLMSYGARGLQGEFVTVIVMGLALGLLGMATPYFTREIFDTVIPGADKRQLIQMVGGLVAAALGVASFEFVRGIAVGRVEGKMDYSIQAAMWDRLLSLPLGFFRRYTSGDLAARAYGIDKIRELVSGTGVTAVLGMFTGMFYLFQMFQLDLRLALAGTALAAGAALFMGGMNLWQLSHQRHLYGVIGRITSIIFQFISGVAKIRVAGAEDHAFKVWARSFTRQRRISWTVGRITNFLQVFNAVFPVISSLALFYFMNESQQDAAASGEKAISTGDFIAFNAAYGAFVAALLQLSNASLQIFQVVPVYERFKPIITEEPEIDEAKSYPGQLTGDIEIFRVNFRYQDDGPLILKNVSIAIKPGQFVAFVGPSGSGKSTLLRLLLGFEKAESGKVYFDGQDLSTLDIREVRQQIGVVLQTSRLMPTDIYRNIIGNSSLSVEDAMEAAKAAGLDEDVKKMPMGMHTVVAEGGGGFSGGQKQRLMIARALVHKPRMLFLDEATSALDNRTQAIVTASMDRLQATRVVVAHRLSTIRNADKIFVLVAGHVVEQGSYDELMELDGHFAELARRQIA